MHEIKFQAWEKSLKQIIPVYNIDFEKRMINTDSAWRMFDEIELMQYTGLEDRNGKEIYEGYVVKVDGFKLQYYAVEFLEGAFCLTNPAVKDYPLDINVCFPSIGCQLEVVGNIYEHSHLLGGE